MRQEFVLFSLSCCRSRHSLKRGHKGLRKPLGFGFDGSSARSLRWQSLKGVVHRQMTDLIPHLTAMQWSDGIAEAAEAALFRVPPGRSGTMDTIERIPCINNLQHVTMTEE
ncbi:hypothetical protein CAPTEDRAFT_204310 [Capitella teleta]|uniref:Uncharacterized protein n=1 Tax=Capitella teleta TaxID=283909 RepID=R7V696_CAPTE|nr:hypothetical protein CAPTEDRAFT_204310 [Capitella teleta]|eukprot:ELU14383.1 hypothetical protein CAPTEDRAFT_204310 [Capitella teleta]